MFFNRKRNIITALLLVGLTLIGLTGCEPPVKQVPTTNRIALAGDSIAWQAMLYGDGTTISTWDTQDKLYPGWRAADAQARVVHDVATVGKSPAVLVVEFGHNYSTWGQTQKNELAALVAAPHPDTCVVLVKPHPGPKNAAVINGYRASVDGLAAARPNTVVVDWSPVVQAHPEYLQVDGVHLNVPPWDYGIPAQAPAVAFSQLVVSGISLC